MYLLHVPLIRYVSQQFRLSLLHVTNYTPRLSSTINNLSSSINSRTNP
jgi:hypothetical protein